jgi:hypothetical protein
MSTVTEALPGDGRPARTAEDGALVPPGAQVLAEAAAAAVVAEDLMTAWTAGKTLLSMTVGSQCRPDLRWAGSPPPARAFPSTGTPPYGPAPSAAVDLEHPGISPGHPRGPHPARSTGLRRRHPPGSAACSALPSAAPSAAPDPLEQAGRAMRAQVAPGKGRLSSWIAGDSATETTVCA